MKIKLSQSEIREYLDIQTPKFPKYVSYFINLANRYSQGTRPKVVGQMSELIQQFTGKSLPEWEEWYLQQKPEALTKATEKILQKLTEFKEILAKIDRRIVEEWVRDLVIVKTFIGLRFQEAILKRGAELKGTDYRLSSPVEESEGIDGYIGGTPVSIKPVTYRSMAPLTEQITTRIIWYEKVNDGVEVDYTEIL
ncbi:MAG: MjaI family restriction endonuclease [Bacillota bacterium]